MKADFLDAHQRHWDDAKRLFEAHRWANADHLYGLAAECGLKRLMLAFGMPVDSNKGDPLDDWHIADRYAHQSGFDEARTLAHQAGAAIICDLIKRAQREGLLT